MNDSLYIAATGMQMQQQGVDTIANNLANVNTPGFKKGRISFQDLVYREVAHANAANQTEPGASLAPFWVGSGVGLASLAKSFQNGELKKTDAPLDLALQGEGFLELVGQDGVHAYSRGGSFIIDKDGFLATSTGYTLKPAIHIGQDAKEITINGNGQVFVKNAVASDAIEVGRIELAQFNDLSGLKPIGNNMYQPTERSGEAAYGKPGEDGMAKVAQGYIESSNVNLVEEMVNLMIAQRAYESSVKVIQASDEMLAMSNNLRK